MMSNKESHDSKQQGGSREEVKKSGFVQHPKVENKSMKKLRSSDLALRKASELHRLLGAAPQETTKCSSREGKAHYLSRERLSPAASLAGL